MFELVEGVRGWFRVSNEGVVKSIWVEQPDGSRRLFTPYKENRKEFGRRDIE